MIQVRTVIMTVMTMRAIRVTVIDLLMVVLIYIYREREPRAAMRRGSPRPPSWAEFVERLFALWMHGIVCVVFKDDSPKPPAWDLVLCVCVRWHGFIMFVAAGSADAGSHRCADAGGGPGAWFVMRGDAGVSSERFCSGTARRCEPQVLCVSVCVWGEGRFLCHCFWL